MKSCFAYVFLILALVTGLARAGEPEDRVAGEAVARAWLVHMDAGDYGGAWEAASTFWKNDYTKAKTIEVLASLRDHLGKLKERQLSNASFHKVPDGDSLVLVFKTQFADAELMLETVELLREKDGSWKVSLWMYRAAKGG